MNNMNNNTKYFSQGKRLSYKALSKSLPSEAVEKALNCIYESQSKIDSYQKKIKKASSVTQNLEKGSPVLGVVGKTAGFINSWYEISVLDTLETAAHLADYSKKRQLTKRGKQMSELLNQLNNKLENLAKFFRRIDDVKQQNTRKEEWADVNCPMNFVEVNDDWEGEKELNEIELELEREQKERDRKIGQQWEEINEKDYQPELTIKATVGAFDEESILEDNLADAFADNEWKPIINSSSEENWTDWEELAQQRASSNQSNNYVLKYAKKAQQSFRIADEKINDFVGELATIKKLIKEVEKQFGYSLYDEVLSKLHLDSEKLIKELKNAVKWTDKIYGNVNWVGSYAKEGENFVNKVVDKLERKAEYQELVANPYAYNNKKDILVFESEIDEKVQQQQQQQAQIQQQNKSWFSKFLNK